MNDTDGDTIDRYDLAIQSGRKEIVRSWPHLRGETRAWLSRAGDYTEYGNPILSDDRNSDVEEIEYILGLFKLCLAARLPGRNENGAPIPADACSTEVKSAFSSLLYSPWHEPVFLRSALLSLRHFEMANLLCRLPAVKPYSMMANVGRLAFVGFCLILLLVTPAVISGIFVSAMHGDSTETMTAMYFLGFIAWMFNISRGLSNSSTETKDEQAYAAWSSLNPYQSGDWTARGNGALAHFEQMLRRDLEVPSVAFDLCEGLRASTSANR